MPPPKVRTKCIMKEPGRDESENGFTVPLFGTWRNAYSAVVAVFVMDITVFYLLSRYFA
jgi:hypothetical protein